MHLVGAILKLAKVAAEPWVVDRLGRLVRLQIRLRHISAKTAAVVHQHVIPGLLFNRLRLVRVIPSVARHAVWIIGYDYATVAIQFMLHNRSDFEAG